MFWPSPLQRWRIATSVSQQFTQRLQRDALSARLDLILIRIGLYLALAGDFDTRPGPVLALDELTALPAAELPEGESEMLLLPEPLPFPQFAPEIDPDE